jgi:tetratricopeptide (TPR) repeat protein
MLVRTANRQKLRQSRLLGALFAAQLFLLDMAVAQTHPPGADSASAQLLLLDGVRAFRAEHYDEALVIFRRIESEQSPADIGFYLGMTLHKLGRHAEALTVFRAAHRAGLREPVADYYQAVSCFRLGLFTRAQQGFSVLTASAGKRAAADAPVLGPRLQLGAKSFLSAIDGAHFEAAGAQRSSAIQRYEAALARATALTAEHDDEALEWLDEAVQLFVQLPERAERMPALKRSVLQLRHALHGKPAESDLLILSVHAGL